jgi:hypothetical protein
MALVLRQPKRVYPRMPKRLPLIEQYPLYTLSFNGTDGYMDCGNSVSLDITDAITVEFWLKTDRAIDYQFALSKGSGGSGYEFAFDSIPRVDWEMRNGTNLWLASARFTYVNAWHHFAGTFDGSTGVGILYIDGVLKGQVTGASIGSNPTAKLYIGARAPSNLATRGFIALVRIYHRVLSQVEIQYNIYNPLNPIRDGLVLFLPMIEGLGTAVYDYSGQGNNGTLYGGVSWRELMKYELPAAIGW